MVEAKTVPESGTLFLDEPQLEGALGLSIAVDRVLFHKRSEYQDIHIIQAGPLGRMLILDGIIQTSDFDETAYHEMLVHVPLLTHPHPERILVIGGGDGGTVREIAKHPTVEHIDLCEIDGEVIDACRTHLPSLAQGLDDPRVHVHLKDGARFVADMRDNYDVILVDSPDPVGPAETLFKREFYADLKKALKPGGVIVSQAESYFLYQDLIRQMLTFLSDMFAEVFYYNTMVPTYISGVIGFAFCSMGPDPLTGPDLKRVEALGDLEYYSPAVHRGAFALPQKCQKLLPPKTALRQSRFLP